MRQSWGKWFFFPLGCWVVVNSLLPHKEAAWLGSPGSLGLCLVCCLDGVSGGVVVPFCCNGVEKAPQKKRLSGMCGSVGGTEEGRLEQPLRFEFWDQGYGGCWIELRGGSAWPFWKLEEVCS